MSDTQEMDGFGVKIAMQKLIGDLDLHLRIGTRGVEVWTPKGAQPNDRKWVAEVVFNTLGDTHLKYIKLGPDGTWMTPVNLQKSYPATADGVAAICQKIAIVYQKRTRSKRAAATILIP